MGKITLSKAEYDRIMNYGTEKDPEYDPDALTYDDYVYGADAIRRRRKYLQSYRDYLGASGTANNVTGSFAGQEQTNADSYRSELQGFLRYLETASKSALERGSSASYRAISQARDSLNIDPSADDEEEKQYLKDAKDAVTRQSERNRDYLGVRNPRGLDFHFSNAFGQSDKQSRLPGLTPQITFGKGANSSLSDSTLSAASKRTTGQAADETRKNNYAQMDPALAEEALMGFYATRPQDYTTNQPYTTADKDRLTELAQQLRVSQRENKGSIAYQRQKALEEEAARRQAWFDERADKYANIPLKDDFEQNISGWEDVGKANDQLMTEAARGYELTVPLENRDADTQNALKQQEADSSYNVYRMSPTERKVYRYLQNTEGDDAAKDYMDYLSYRLNARNMNEVRAAAERGTETTGGKWVHSALSVPANLAGGALGAADYAIQNVRSKFSYRPIDYNSGGQIPGEYASAVRENTQEDMGSVGKFVYGTAMSMADSAASMLTIGKGGGTLLGLSAGRQGVKDAIDAGATDSQAIAMGLFNGAAEMIFENIGIDNLYSILESGGTRTFKAAVKSILGQALSEGTEEVGTTLANTWGDAVIMADKSEINRMIDEYMSEGASREQATRAAWLNWAQSLGMDFLGGLTSGALFGIGGTIIANAKNDSEIGQIIKRDGLPDGMRIEDAISEVTNVPNLYSNSTDTLALYIRESGIENVSDRTLGRFYRLFTQDQQNLRLSGLSDVDVAEYVERGMEPYREPRTNVESSIARDEAGNVDVEQTLRNAAQEKTAMEVSRENEQSDANTRRAWEDALPASQQNTEALNQNMPVTAQENAQYRSVTSTEESVMQAQKTPQAAENGVQAAYVKGGRISDAEMSDSGAAKNSVQLANGETAQVQNISVSDNGVVLETSHGKALADDVQIDDPSLYTIVSAAEKYDTQGAQALFRGYENSDLSAQNYVRAFESAYESGHVGLDYGTFLEKGGYATFLDKDTRMAAYAAGQRVFTSDKETASVRGGVVEKFSGELTREQRAAVNALNAYGRAIGRTINIVDSIDVKKKDGSVRKSGANATFNPKTNEYTIALDAQGQAYVAVALHESVHDIAANQPQMYDMLHTTVMEYLKMEGEDIDALRAEWRDRIGDMSDERIDEEITGNTVPVILSDKETAQDFAERFLDSDEKKSAFRRLIDSILDFLKRAYDKLKNLKSWRTMKTLEVNIQAVQDIREVMFDALDELRNGDVGQKNDSAVEIKESRKSPKNSTKKVEQSASPLSRRSVKAENGGEAHTSLDAAARLFDIATIDEKSESVKQAISALGDIYTSIETNKPLPNGRKTVRPSSLIGNMVSLGILKRGGEGRSAYRSDNGHTLRISDHSANAENFVDKGENLSVALFNKGRMNFFFEGKNNVIEAVFRTSYLDQNTDAFKNMIGDIARFIATGEYHDTAGALTYHYSGSENFVQEAQERMLNDAVQRQINSVDEETAQRIIADEDGVRYSSRDIDTETLDMLESLDEDELITTYRSMQLIDGKLYPPMAAVVSGSMEDASQIGSWERAVEHPELVKIDNKGRAKFTLNKGKGQGTISAAYNPYMHSSNLMLNDQFTGAYKRPNLVTVECVVPASEMTSGYHAEFAKDATGWHEWHAGPVASNVSEQRNVFLSRWLKPVRIVDNAEVAREYQRLLSGTNASVPYNVVSPGLLVELEKIGVPIDDKGSGKVPPRKDIRYSLREDSEGHELTEAQEEYFRDSQVRDADGKLKVVYHGSAAQFTEFSADFMSQHGSAEGQGFYFTDYKPMAQGYEGKGGQLLEGYLDIKKPLSDSDVTLSKAEVKRLIQALDPTGDDLVLNYDSRGGMGYPSRAWYNRSVEDTLRAVMSTSDSDSEILAELANGMGDPGKVLKTTRELLGYDGYIVDGKYDNASVYVAFDSSQFKNVTNLNPTSDPDIRFSLREGMTEAERYKELKDASINVPAYNAENGVLTQQSVANLERMINRDARYYVSELFDKLGLSKTYENKAAQITFEFSSRGKKKSVHEQSARGNSYADFAKMLTCFDQIVEGAVPIEIHADKYKGTRREVAQLKSVYVLVSAFADDSAIVPVQLEIKEYVNEENQIYLAVTMGKIKEGVVATSLESDITSSSEALPSYTVSLQELFSKINPSDGDFLKYVPDGFLSEEQRSAKQAALMREERKIDGLRFSLRDTSSVDIATVEKENAQLREANEELRKQFRRTVGVQLDQKAIRKMARDLIKQYDSSYSLDTLTDNLSKVFDVVANGGLTWDEASSAVVDMCRKALEESSSFDTELYEYDQPVREYLKNVRLEISDDMRGGIELVADNGAAYRRGLFGIVGTAKKGSGVSIDQIWREASEMFPTYFSEDAVNPEDQAERLYHLAQRLKKSSYFVNAFAQNIDAAAYDMMLQIGAKYPGIPHTQTFADKFAAKVNEARAKTKKAYDAKLAQLRAQQKTSNRTARRLDAKATKIANRMLQQQARYEAQLESQNKKIERMEVARDKSKDTARRKKYRDRISKNAAALYQWLAKPTDKAHVPENIRAAVTQLVRAIDLSSGTKYGEAWRQRLSALADQFDKSTLDAAYQSFANSIDPDLSTDIRAFVDSQTGVTVSDMDADHLQTLSELLNRVKKAVTEANKFHAAERSRTVQEVAIKTREEFNRKRVFSETKSGKAVQSIIDFNQADAVTLFHYLGKEAETIYNAVRQGFDKYVLHVRDAQQYAAEVLKKAGDKKQYSKTHKFHVDGKDVELSVAQIMTLYELSQRPQAAEHLYDGGIVLIKRSVTGAQKEKTHVRVTKQDIADMTAVLTDSQKTVADALQRFMQEDSAAWGNDATMTVYGYRKFGEDHYFPIDSDRDFISTSGKDSSNNGDLYALRNWRSSKSTVEGASNPLIVGDIFDVWTKHVSEMAKYGAYLAPMDDMLKWYNWRGRDGSGRQISVREALNGAFGKKNAAKFVETFIKNINGSGRIDVAAQDKIFDTMVRNAKAAAVGANLSVAIQQPTAYARAYAEIDVKYLALAFAQKPNMQLAQQYCPIAQWKAWGFFDVNVGPMLKSVILGNKTWLEKIREVQMFLPELGDNVTWGYIWNACALEVADKENIPPDQRNTEEFYQKVGRRMSEVIDKTQVVDSPFTRSFISSNKGYQAFTAFKNEPMKSYNMLTRAAYDNVYEHTKETKKHLRRSNVAFVAASVFAAMGKAIISALRRNDDKKGDSWAEKALIRLGMTEEGRYTYGQKWMVSTLEETADNLNPLNTHWLTSAVVEMIERAVSGTNYSSGRIDEKTISSIEDFAKLIKKLTEGKDVETYRLVYKGAEMVSYLTGIGFQSLLKDFKGIANALSDAISPDYTPTMDDAFILIERGDVGSVEIAAALEAAANEILAKTPSISEEKAMQQAESDLRSKVTNRYKDDYINAFEKGYTQKAKQIAEWMYATGLYEDRGAVDDVVRGWLVDYYKEAYLAAKTDAERSNIFEKLYATKKWRNRAELKKAIRGWTEAKD